MKRMVGVMLLSCFVWSAGCKKEAAEITTEVKEEPAQGAGQVKVEGNKVSVETKEGKATVQGASVNVQTPEGTVKTVAGQGGGATVNVQHGGQSAEVKADPAGNVKVNVPGHGAVTIERDKKGGKANINVGGMKIQVPDNADDE